MPSSRIPYINIFGFDIQPMSRYSRTPSLTKHRSWKTETLATTLSMGDVFGATGPSTSAKVMRHPHGRAVLHLSRKSKICRQRSLIAPVLLLVVVFVFQWWYLSSLRHGILPTDGLSVNPASTFVQLRTGRYEESSRPMLARLLSLAAHALAEGDSKPEPDELWKEPTKGSSKWRPCADKRPAGYLAPPEPQNSSGYILVSANGGLNQQRVAICNSVAVARLLNATLLLPQFLVSSVWRDNSQFGDIYEEKHFVDYLKDDVRIVSELPVELQSLDLGIIGSILTNLEVPKESKPSFFIKFVLPRLLLNRVVHFYGFENALSFDPVPADIQRLRCRCNFHALRFLPHIKETAGLIVRRMRDKDLRWGPINNTLLYDYQLSTIEKTLVGTYVNPSSQQTDAHIQSGDSRIDKVGTTSVRYLGLHLRFEMDMLAYSLCEFGGGELEKKELEEYREIHFPTLSKNQNSGKLMSAAKRRDEGKCPLTPEDAVLMLASLGFKRSTRIFLAGADIYGGQARMAILTSLYPNIVTKEDLLTSEELAPFVNHSSQLAALDFIGCAAADAFAMSDSGSQLSSLVSGYRIYYGEGKLPTIRPNKRRLASIFAKNMTIEWEQFEERIRKAVRESKRPLERPIATSIYRHPRCNQCMCRGIFL